MFLELYLITKKKPSSSFLIHHRLLDTTPVHYGDEKEGG